MSGQLALWLIWSEATTRGRAASAAFAGPGVCCGLFGLFLKVVTFSYKFVVLCRTSDAAHSGLPLVSVCVSGYLRRLFAC